MYGDIIHLILSFESHVRPKKGELENSAENPPSVSLTETATCQPPRGLCVLRVFVGLVWLSEQIQIDPVYKRLEMKYCDSQSFTILSYLSSHFKPTNRR